MRQAVENTAEHIQTAKLSSVVRFSSNLRQLTTLNHLANEFRKTFQQNDTIWPILLRDLEKIDFVKIQVRIPSYRKRLKFQIRIKYRGLQTVPLKISNAFQMV